MQKYVIILLLFMVFDLGAQSNFVKAKITKDNGEELNVKLGLYNWIRVPENIKYQNDEKGEILIIDRNEVSKIEIDEGYTYIKAKVDIDKSLLSNQKYDTTKKVEYVSKTLFLRVLIEGKASLYDNYRHKRPIYFFKTENEPIAQLIYKPYQSDNAKINYNRGYIYQLTESLECNNIHFDNYKFSKEVLLNYFREYNTCVNQPYTDYSVRKSSQKLLGLNVTVGLETSQLDYIQNDIITYPFGSEISPRFGVEMDFQLPINSRNRWIAYLGSSLRFYESQSEIVGRSRTGYNVKYSFVELTCGARYILNFFKTGGLVFEGGYALQITGKEEVSSATDFPTGLDGQRVFPFLSSGVTLGTGVQFSKNQIHVRFYLPSKVDGNLGFTSKLNSISILYSRSIF